MANSTCGKMIVAGTIDRRFTIVNQVVSLSPKDMERPLSGFVCFVEALFIVA
jgi:hypothetical protein